MTEFILLKTVHFILFQINKLYKIYNKLYYWKLKYSLIIDN